MSKFFCRLILRPSKRPTAVSLGVRSVGASEAAPHQKGWRKTLDFAQLFWSTSGEAKLRLKGRNRLIKPGQIAVNLPGDEHYQFTEGSSWSCRFVTLDGPAAADTMRQLGLVSRQPLTAGPCPTEQFDLLETIVPQTGREAEREASRLAYDLLLLAARRLDQDASSGRQNLVDRALDLIAQELANPDLGVAQLADQLQVHRSVLTRRFQKRLGMAPSRYLVRSRLQHVCRLLERTSLPIAKIAAKTGFANPGYLAELFHEVHGMTPSEYRRRSGGQDPILPGLL